MKKYLYILGLIVMLSGFYTSCNDSSLDSLREDEVAALDKYVNDNNLTTYKDASGMYYKEIEKGTGDSIKSNYKVMLQFKITLINGTVVFTTEDAAGRNYEEYAFYVDESNAATTQSYVQQIAGLHIGLKKMLVGGRAFMVIPSELAFRANDYTAAVGVPRFSTLLATVYAKKGFSPEEREDQ